MKVKSESEVAQSCPTLSDPMDCSPPGPSVHGIFQARVLEWVAIAFSKLTVWCIANQIPYNHTVEVTNRFKGLDLIDRVLEELWIQIHDMVQEAVIKIIPKNKKCKKTKWLSKEDLQIAEKRREAKVKREKERYSHQNTEF